MKLNLKLFGGLSSPMDALIWFWYLSQSIGDHFLFLASVYHHGKMIAAKYSPYIDLCRMYAQMIIRLCLLMMLQ